jgi:hypothetical protein
MIKASEAKRKSIINSKGKKYLDELEKHINHAIKDGLCSATTSIDLTESNAAYNNENLEIRNAVVEELVQLGYTVDFKYAKPLPSGCPSDQWDFYNGHIKVTW